MAEKNKLPTFEDVDLPYSLETEQAVIGSILINPECVTQVLSHVKPDYFYIQQDRLAEKPYLMTLFITKFVYSLINESHTLIVWLSCFWFYRNLLFKKYLQAVKMAFPEEERSAMKFLINIETKYIKCYSIHYHTSLL